MKFLRSLALGLGAALALTAGLAATPSVANEKAIIVLDGSGSMWAQIDGKSRIEIARQTLKQVLKGLPDDLELGLMSYGHRTKGDCDDIEMLVEPKAGSADAIIAAADKINPKGKTPISEAVRLAAEDLRFTEEKATVILITDGLETCEADPCALASELEGQGVDFTTHVLGFGLTDEEGKQVACLAENTGGKYFPASDADGLAKALTETVTQVAEAEPAPAPEPEAPAYNFAPDVILAEGGESLPKDADVVWDFRKPTSDGSEGEWIATEYGGQIKVTRDPGTYAVYARIGYATTMQTITIEPGKVAEPLFVLNAGQLIIHPYASEGAPVSDDATVEIDYAGEGTTTSYGTTKLYVPAGDQVVKVKLGNGEAETTINVPAGETVEQDVVLSTGHILVNALYTEGMPVEESGMGIKILEAKKNIQGERKEMSYGFGPGTQYDLPPGDYVARVDLQAAVAETPFTVKAGEETEIVVLLDAGVLAIEGPAGTDRFEIFEPKKDIQGNRKQVAYEFGQSVQITLNAGDYVVVTYGAGDSVKETPVSIAAGERTEVTVE